MKIPTQEIPSPAKPAPEVGGGSRGGGGFKFRAIYNATGFGMPPSWKISKRIGLI